MIKLQSRLHHSEVSLCDPLNSNRKRYLIRLDFSQYNYYVIKDDQDQCLHLGYDLQQNPNHYITEDTVLLRIPKDEDPHDFDMLVLPHYKMARVTVEGHIARIWWSPYYPVNPNHRYESIRKAISNQTIKLEDHFEFKGLVAKLINTNLIPKQLTHIRIKALETLQATTPTLAYLNDSGELSIAGKEQLPAYGIPTFKYGFELGSRSPDTVTLYYTRTDTDYNELATMVGNAPAGLPPMTDLEDFISERIQSGHVDTVINDCIVKANGYYIMYRGNFLYHEKINQLNSADAWNALRTFFMANHDNYQPETIERIIYAEQLNEITRA